MSTILSFDVGIKNLAYCKLKNKSEICDWNVINIIDDIQLSCSCKNKNNLECKSKATFYKKEDEIKIGYCNKHQKCYSEFFLHHH